MIYDIDKIKEINVEDICKVYGISLTRKGENYWGKIRNEKTSSFSINPSKNIWRDWGLNVGGDNISLVAFLEGIDNGKAIQVLGERFNIDKEAPTNTLPTRNQLKEIGIVSERAMSNFDISLDKQDVSKLEDLEKQYSISMSDLSKSNEKLYHKIIDRKAMPLIYEDRNMFFEIFKRYENEIGLEKDLYGSMLKDLEKNLNNKISIYNNARIDNVNLDNLKVDMNNIPQMKKELEKMSDSFNPFEFNKDVDVTQIVENLKNGVGNIFTNENFSKYLDFQSKFHTYSHNNNILIGVQRPNATFVASFAKWNSLGRSVNKGEKGIAILAPNVRNYKPSEIIDKLDKDKSLNVGKYRFFKNDNSYAITSKGATVKNNVSRRELESFIKNNDLKFQAISGFRKTYVFDISQTSGKEIPMFKVNKLSDNELLDSNGFYKNPYLKVQFSEGDILPTDKLITFKQANELYEAKEKETIELRKEYEAKGEYYPYFKQKFDVVLKPNEPLSGIAKDIRIDIGDGEHNNLLEALKSEMKGYPQVFDSLEETLKSNDRNMETIIGIRNEIESLIKDKSIQLEYSTDTGSANGFFSPPENKIVVNSTLSLSQTTKTLLHEYVHSQLHNVPKGDIAKDNLDFRQTAEIEAEATTYVVAKHFGFDTSEYSFDYVSTWARGKEISALENTLKTIKSSAEKIINDIKSPLELNLYNNKETIKDILKSENIKPTDKIVKNMIDINKATGKINTISDLTNAEKYKSYGADKELSSKIGETNKEISNNVIEVKSIKIDMER